MEYTVIKSERATSLFLESLLASLNDESGHRELSIGGWGEALLFRDRDKTWSICNFGMDVAPSLKVESTSDSRRFIVHLTNQEFMRVKVLFKEKFSSFKLPKREVELLDLKDYLASRPHPGDVNFSK